MNSVTGRTPYIGGKFNMTSRYGIRTLGGARQFHRGVDLVGASSKNVCAVAPGVVAASTMITDRNNKTWEWGNYVCVQGDDGNYIYYCHLGERSVTVGKRVAAGDILGVEGNTGYSFGSHLHLEVRLSDGMTTTNAADYIGINNAVGAYEITDTEEYEMTRYKRLSDIPNDSGFRDIVGLLMSAGVIEGDGSDPQGNGDIIDLSYDQVRTLVFLYRGGGFDRRLSAAGLPTAVK